MQYVLCWMEDMETRFLERLASVMLVGIPFAVFKVVAGWTVIEQLNGPLGTFIFAWGAMDAVLNLLSLSVPTSVSYCVLSNVGRTIDRSIANHRWENLLLAVDTVLSFGIVAVMIWFGLLRDLPPLLTISWNAAVVCNVLGAGLSQLWREIRATRGGAERTQ